MKNTITMGKKEHTTLLTTYNAGLLQGKANRVLHDHLAFALKPYNLSVTEWKILGQLHDNQRLLLHEIAEILDVEPPLITKMIESLEHKRLVTKGFDKNDKRVKVVTISHDGKTIITKAEKRIRTCLKELLKGVHISELLTYAKVLKKIVHNSYV